MRLTNSYVLRMQLAIYFGLIAAVSFDLTVHTRAEYPGLSAPADRLLLNAAVIMLLLFIMAMALERYVRPLSRAGALMTGFCGYALLRFLLP